MIPLFFLFLLVRLNTQTTRALLAANGFQGEREHPLNPLALAPHSLSSHPLRIIALAHRRCLIDALDYDDGCCYLDSFSGRTGLPRR